MKSDFIKKFWRTGVSVSKSLFEKPVRVQLRFPMVPEGYWDSDLDDFTIRAYLHQVLQWRGAIIASVKGEHRRGLITQDLIDLLLWALGTTPDKDIDHGPYTLTAFPQNLIPPAEPADTTKSAAKKNVLDILVWRAQIVDFLADVWDTVGPALFDMEECGRATEWFMPHELEDAEYCPLCLQIYPQLSAGEVVTSHYECCPIQQIWERCKWVSTI